MGQETLGTIQILEGDPTPFNAGVPTELVGKASLLPTSNENLQNFLILEQAISNEHDALMPSEGHGES